MAEVLSGADVYKPRPNYRLTMRSKSNALAKVVAVSRRREQLMTLEADLTNCDYEFIMLEEIGER